MSDGYSGTPLPKKLGIKKGNSVALIAAPRDFVLKDLPENVTVGAGVSRRADVTVIFVSWQAELEATIKDLGRVIFPDRVLWVAWPKKAAKLPGDMTDNAVREIALPLGLVDVKVCAIDHIWAGLKLVWRVELRDQIRPPL